MLAGDYNIYLIILSLYVASWYCSFKIDLKKKRGRPKKKSETLESEKNATSSQMDVDDSSSRQGKNTSFMITNLAMSSHINFR